METNRQFLSDGRSLPLDIKQGLVGGQGFQSVERRHPIKTVTIENKDLEFELLDDFVTDIFVDQNTDGLSVAKLVLHNLDTNYLVNERLFSMHNKIKIWLGYLDTGQEYQGEFRIQRPTYQFAERAQKIELYCVSLEYDLMHTERRQAYFKKTDSDIARDIAKRNNLKFDIESTSTLYAQVIQANQSDIKFLESRARLYGYDVFIKNGVLHFHSPRYDHSGISVYYDNGDNSLITEMDIRVDSWYSGVNWQVTKFDPKTKELYGRQSSNEKGNALQRDLLKRNNNDIQPHEYSSVNTEQPVRYLVGEGHNQTLAEADKQVQSFSEASRYGVRSCGVLDLGLEVLKPRTIITVLGVGRFSGDYYITRVFHKYSQGYKVNFELARLGFGNQTDEPLVAFLQSGHILKTSEALALTQIKSLQAI